MSPERRELQLVIERARANGRDMHSVSWAIGIRSLDGLSGQTRYAINHRGGQPHHVADVLRRVRTAGGMIAKDRR